MIRFLPRVLPWLLTSLLGVLWIQTRHAAQVQDQQLARLRRDNADLRFNLKESSAQIASLTAQASDLDRNLGSAKTHTTVAINQRDILSYDLATAKQLLVERQQKEVALLNELARLRQTPPAAEANVAQERISTLEAHLVDLLTRALLEPAAVTTTPSHQVIKLGPENAFVLIDYGSSHGAQPGEIIQLRRGTTILAQAQISDASPRFSVAQIQPASLKGQLQTGDRVVSNK